MNCLVDGCAKEPTRLRRTVCEMHYCRKRRTGSYGGAAPKVLPRGTCSVAGCERPTSERRMCSMHGTRTRRHGSPDVVVAPPDRATQRLSAHHAWTGNHASYNAAHLRVSAARGAAKRLRCTDCDSPARHWSYDHNDPAEVIDDRGYAYSTEPRFYSPRCVPCHKQMDVALKRKVGAA